MLDNLPPGSFVNQLAGALTCPWQEQMHVFWLQSALMAHSTQACSDRETMVGFESIRVDYPLATKEAANVAARLFFRPTTP